MRLNPLEKKQLYGLKRMKEANAYANSLLARASHCCRRLLAPGNRQLHHRSLTRLRFPLCLAAFMAIEDSACITCKP